MKKTFMILFALLTLLALTMTGCGKRSSGIYSSEEMTQIHDVSGSVENMSRVYDNVVNKSLPSTINSRLAKDPGYGEYLSTMTIDPSKPMIALTFDDGPNDSSTVQILDTLEKYNARATFFVVGSNAKEHGDILKRMSTQGCEIGNHTYDHVELTTLDADNIKKQLSKTDEVIKQYTGQDCKVVRPPGGAVTVDTRKTVDRPMILWYIDTRDWESRNAASVISNAETYAEDGAIVLMHDIYDSTAQAVASIVPDLKDKGYQFVTISQLAYMKGEKLVGGGEYFSFVKNKGGNENITSDVSEGEYVDMSGNAGSYRKSSGKTPGVSETSAETSVSSDEGSSDSGDDSQDEG